MHNCVLILIILSIKELENHCHYYYYFNIIFLTKNIKREYVLYVKMTCALRGNITF